MEIDTKPQTHSKIKGEVNKKTINNTNPTANTSPQTYVFFYPTLTQINFKAPDQKIASQSFIEKLLIRIYDSGALWNLWKATLCLIGGCGILLPLSQKNQATKHLASAVIDFASLSNLAMAGYKFFRYSPQTISTQSAAEADQITNQDLTIKELKESLKFV